MELKVRSTAHNDVQVVSPVGEIDVWTAEKLKTSLQDAEAAAGSHDIVVDLSQVSFLDSTGIGVLIGCLRRRREEGASLHLITDQTHILKILSITNLDTVFEVHSSLDAALDIAQ